LAPTPAPASDALFRAAADQAPQVMWIVNVKGAVTYLNRAWYELVGGEPPKWYGHEWADVVDPEDVVQMRDRWSAASATGSIFEGTRRVKAQDGTWHTLAYKATPVFENGRATCWIGMDADITALMAAQAALRVANQELEAFSYSVSHDLRAPLVTVQGFSRTLVRQLGGSADPKVLHSVERISASIEYLGRLVDGLLALSHVTRMKLRQEEVDLSPMASDILERLQRSQPERAAVLTVQPELRARCDSRLVSALLENLLGNAWKFTSAMPRTEIAFGLTARSPQDCTFFVKDNGVGFDMAHAKHLFNAFERLHDAEQFPGMGIGLATVNRIALRHGGRAWAESQPGQGACFYFTLPRA
jgi:PAS domain S-box-containing protein